MIFVATLILLGAIWLSVWARFRDPFHPLIIMLPAAMFIYGALPLAIYRADQARFMFSVGDDFLYTYHALMIALLLALVLGVQRATRGLTRQTMRWQQLDIDRAARVRFWALVLGLIGAAAFVYGIWNAGGLAGAYGRAYGGGAARSGYVRELRYIGLIGVLLVYVLRVGKGMRVVDWLIILLCILPTVTHGLLGARRGPTFLAAIVTVGGYVFFMRKRIPLPVIIAAGAGLGLGMLFLVANRNAIYIGSQLDSFRNPLETLERWTSNEYLIGSTVVRYALQEGSFYGLRELSHLIGRILPSFVWPTVYTDLPHLLGLDVDIRVNVGMNPARMAEIVGWTPSVGSAEGFGASLWMEFGFLAFPVAYVIGLLYGRVWVAARDNVTARIVYLLMAALSIYLMMQNFDPWIYRLLLFGGPAWLAARMIQAAPRSAQPRSPRAARPPLRPRHP